jgi:FkbM family methyltransferase
MYRLRPPHWRLRQGTVDRRLFRDVVLDNEYRLPRRLSPRDVVLDVGGHIGCFALAALQRGVGRVDSYEPDADNFELLQAHLTPFGGRARAVAAAVWRSDRPARHLTLRPCPDRTSKSIQNTGALQVMESDTATLTAVAFDDLVRDISAQTGRPIPLLKLDCEGAEWPILLTSTRLHQVDAICGEYHDWPHPEFYHVPGYPELTPQVLHDFLRRQGYAVRVERKAANPLLGLFFAWRRPGFFVGV